MEELFAKAVFLNFITDLSSVMEGDIAHVPDVFTNSFSVQTQSTQGAEVTTAGPAQTDVTLTVDTHEYVAHIIGDKDQQQLMNSYDFNSVYARKTGKTLVNSIESSIAALWSGLTSNTIGDTATVLKDLEIRQSIEALDKGHFDMQETGWFIHPTVWWLQLAGIQKYYDKSQAGGDTSLTIDGNFGPMDASRGLQGNLYGIDLFTTTNVVSGLQTYRNMLLHKEAFGYATQTPGGSTVRVQSENAIRNLGLLTVADTVYGVTELRDEAAVLVNANTSATTA